MSRKTKKYVGASEFGSDECSACALLLFTVRCVSLLSQAVKNNDSEDGAETETGDDGEEGEKDKEDKEKEGEEKTEPPLEDDTKKHGFLILSREDSTMVKLHIIRHLNVRPFIRFQYLC